jgi:hypothetical protein
MLRRIAFGFSFAKDARYPFLCLRIINCRHARKFGQENFLFHTPKTAALFQSIICYLHFRIIVVVNIFRLHNKRGVRLLGGWRVLSRKVIKIPFAKSVKYCPLRLMRPPNHHACSSRNQKLSAYVHHE